MCASCHTAGENATIDIAAHFALVAADYLVTDHPSLSWPRARHRQKANAPYHAVWTWCADGDACASQNHNATAFVNVDVRHGPPQSSSSRQQLEVRTTIWPEWMALPAAAASDSNGGIGDPHPYGMWRKRDVCVGYGAGELIVPSWWNNVLWKGQFADRKALLMQSAAPSSSSSSLPPRLLWPLRFPRHYVDGSPKPFNSGFDKQEGFFGEIAQASRITAPTTTTTTTNAPMWHRVLGPRPTKPILGMKETPLRSTWHDATTAILVEASMDNLFHILFHALPLREDLARLSRDGALSAGSGGASAAYELLPRYTVLWPGASSSRGWPGWEMATRALSTALPHSNHMAMPTAEQTDSRIEPLSLHCYPLVIGGHSPFWPSFDNGTELVAARPRVAALRKALWQSVKRSRMSMDRPLPHDAAASSSSSTILFQTRHTSRVRAMDNFDAVRDALLADAALAPHVRFIAMEELLSPSSLKPSAVRASSPESTARACCGRRCCRLRLPMAAALSGARRSRSSRADDAPAHPRVVRLSALVGDEWRRVLSAHAEGHAGLRESGLSALRQHDAHARDARRRAEARATARRGCATGGARAHRARLVELDGARRVEN